jgi:gas vesicle protein
MEDAGKGLGYFFLGLGVGAAVGILFAPRSGTATRNYLQTKTHEGTDYVKQQGQDLVDVATGTIERGKRKLRNQVNSLSDAVDAGKQAYRETVEATPFATLKT